MDEFLDFHHSANAPAEGSGPAGRAAYASYATPASAYDIDLILAHAAADEGSFHSLQHYDIDGGPFVPAGAQSDALGDRAARLHGFPPSWLATADRPPVPCDDCLARGLDCLIPRDRAPGAASACDGCAAVGQPCSLATAKTAGPVLRSSPQTYPAASVPNSRAVAPPESRAATPDGSPRAGARFSRDIVRLLRNWLSLHHLHPYPTEDEKDELQRKTGLTKVQITNWLANARRRGQVKPPRAASPGLRPSKPLNVTQKPLPALENMGPMERWKNSPPEHEPATVTDIAKAVTSSASALTPSQNSPRSYPRSDGGSGPSGSRASSIMSRNSSRSSGVSLASANSHHSQGSFGSFGHRGRRRRRHTARLMVAGVAGTPRQYQCTFCTETFKTKHDWQRHEKSLHLSLERWVCAPEVGRVTGKAQKCVFCGIPGPSGAHYETHNYTTCRERPLEERTFYRKDHLRQHLRLVHNCQFLATTMDSWKINAPEIRSRCGFCHVIMNTWASRIDHLAEHFKVGKSMAEWEGDWGFEKNILKLVENGIPPRTCCHPPLLFFIRRWP